MEKMFAFGLGSPQEWMIILVVVVILFGGNKIPELMRGIGKGVGELQRGIESGKQALQSAAEEGRAEAVTPHSDQPQPPLHP